MTPRPSTSFLDGLRGLAALYVVLSHAATFLYTRHPIPTEINFIPSAHWITILNALIVAPFRYADIAVIFFFVLSGFVIHLRQARTLGTFGATGRGTPRLVPAFSTANYLYRRFRRLYPPLLLALLLTASLDALGRHLGYAIYFGHTPYFYINANVADHAPLTFLGNLLFCMGLIVTPFGSDGPLWSLAYEWWFYMIYPLLWPITRRSFGLATTIVSALYLTTLAPNYWPTLAPLIILRKVLMLLPAWWTGAALAEIHSGRWRINLVWLIPFSILIAADWTLPNLLTRLHIPADGIWLDVRYAFAQNIKALGMAGVLCIFFALQHRSFSLSLFDRLGFLGDMSYTLYVIHAPLLIFFAGWCMALHPDAHMPHNLLPFTIGVLAALAIAWLLHFLTERPFSASHKSHMGGQLK